MNLEEFFNKNNIIDLSFFNFRNAITAAYLANNDLQILRVNENFRKFFPVLGNVTNAYFPDVLAQLGVSGEQITQFISDIESKGFVQIPSIHIKLTTKSVYTPFYQRARMTILLLISIAFKVSLSTALPSGASGMRGKNFSSKKFAIKKSLRKIAVGSRI